MTNSKVLFLDLVSHIRIDDEPGEIQSIVQLVLEHLFFVSATDVLMEKQIDVKPLHQQLLQDIVRRINTYEPIQHILKEAPFYGRMFFVNNHVLIPRPETEELVGSVVQWVRGHYASTSPVRIMDIGTGSGCIPVTLALELPRSEVMASDVSEDALAVARTNARRLEADVTFIKHDIVTDAMPAGILDVVVSNPPYIALSEKKAMSKNVLLFEPHLALFVPDEDPLLFYRYLALKSRQVLTRGGMLQVEINARFGREVANEFESNGLSGVQIICDMNGKERFVRGVQP